MQRGCKLSIFLLSSYYKKIIKKEWKQSYQYIYIYIYSCIFILNKFIKIIYQLKDQTKLLDLNPNITDESNSKMNMNKNWFKF